MVFLTIYTGHLFIHIKRGYTSILTNYLSILVLSIHTTHNILTILLFFLAFLALVKYMRSCLNFLTLLQHPSMESHPKSNKQKTNLKRNRLSWSVEFGKNLKNERDNGKRKEIRERGNCNIN